MADGGRWTLNIAIERHEGNQVIERPFSAANLFKQTIRPSSSFTVLEFPSSSVTNIAPPINRTNPGFVGFVERLYWEALTAAARETAITPL